MRHRAPLATPTLNPAEPVADGGHCDSMGLVSHCVSQVVDLIDGIRSKAAVVQDFKVDFAEALGDIKSIFARLVAQGGQA